MENHWKEEAERLRDELDFYKHLIDSSYNWEYMVDINGDCMYVSPSVENITGYSPNEFCKNKKFLLSIIHPEDLPYFISHQNVSGRGEERGHIEFRIIRKDNEIAWISHDGKNVYNSEGNLIGIRGSNRLITEKKNIEKKYDRLSSINKSIIDQSPIGIVTYDMDGNCISANPIATEIVGGTNEELLSENYHRIGAWKKSGLYDQVTDAIINGEIKECEIEIYSPYNKYVYVKCIIVPFPDYGEIDVMILLDDLSDVKQSEKFISSIFNATDEAVYLIDCEEKFVEMNEVGAKSLNSTRNELIGRNVYGFVPENLLDARLAAVNYVLENHKPNTMIEEYNGMFFENRIFPVFDLQNEVSHIATFTKDITEVFNKERELSDLLMSKDKFISVLSHDLRVPFNTLIGFSEILLEKIVEKNIDNIDYYARAIRTTSVQTYELLENLLMWGKSQQDSIKYNIEKHNLNDLLHDVVFLTQSIADSKKIKIKLTLDNNDEVWADQFMIEVVIRNLLSNALKYSHENGVVVINTRSGAHGMIIEIVDTGIGMDPEKASNLFRLEYSASTVGTKGEKGSGLGLLLCKEFVEKHNGKIHVKSELGKGSTFTVELPHKN